MKKNFIKRFSTTLLMLLAIPIWMMSQNISISGNVKDLKGEVLPGVSVLEEGTTNGIMTDNQGNFSINVSSNATLQFFYLGYNTQRVAVAGKQQLNIVMSEDTKLLEEVVVVSYGTQKKRDVTGSISQVNGSNLKDLPVGQIGQKLQGQVAGVQINQYTGKPGESPAFRIRGAASVNGGNSPLFVVDGMVYNSGLNNINPDDIESFSVLKDAAATSLYGSRAANGVILITTKRAKAGQLKVDLNAFYGIQSLNGLKRLDMMDAREFAQYQKETYEDRAIYESYKDGVPEVYQNPEKYGKGTDWYDLLTRTAAIQSYNLSVAGGNDKISSIVILGYHKQEGVVLNTEFERFTLRANNEFKVNDKVKLGLNIAPTFKINKNHGTDGGWNILNSAILMSPILSPYNEDGELNVGMSAPNMFNQPNWLRVIKERTNEHKSTAILSNMFAEIDIWKGIKYKFQAGIDIGNATHRTFTPSTSGGGMFVAPPQKATADYNTDNYYDWNIENMLSYNNTFGDHSIEGLLGYSAQKYQAEFGRLSGTDFPDDKITWIQGASTKNGNSYKEAWAVASFISRLNYRYKDRYLMQATFRRDGSSRFGFDNRYANFPSVSGGWIASEEDFMKPLHKTMNSLKLRASYGLTGNYNIGNYTYIAGIQTVDYVFNETLASGKALSGLGNSQLTWEETKQFNVGIDLGFFNDRLFMMYDYYSKRTDGMLYRIDIPAASGFWDIQSNVGDFKSWGHEFTLQSRNMVGDFEWSTNLNLSFNKNEVMALGTNNTPINGYNNQGSVNRLQVGQPIGVFMGYVYDGVYMTQKELDSQPKHASSEIGTVRMKDLNDDKIIDEKDRTIIGDPNPDFIFGITNDFSYKNFDLSILLTGQVGGNIMDGNQEYTENLDGCFNVLRNVKNRWRSPENPGNGSVPRTKLGTTALYRYTNSSWVYDATYLSVRNITLGYNIPLKSNAYLSKIRLYLTAQNLKTFSKYPGMNPEVSENGMNWNGLGIDKTTYPIPRTFSLGCNITF
ncbi:TonB-linked SusC/RagA family outer membrane protein [Dysgonomonas alginatilytica]|uniref:TonB-linked SusC/RagA family outer membrane protein n=1 Tax=Dysgonomonas alginatilytica TaxID=1605892 RepID=A0A2V3PLH1_9BACT|nr:TonB-dependent receptor [Dysgonomonas alginatilytica]PXV59961.1 TonB-linked SusC/RagA family outer membrane protein [Dysgonomonas alginatilytica]